MSQCGNPVFQPSIPKDSTNPHYQSRFRFRSSIHPRSPLTAWLNSHWIRRYLFFPLLEEQRTHGKQSRRPPKSTITQYPTFWTLLNQPFLTLLEMSHFPTNHHHDNCHPWKTATSGILSHHVTFTPLFLSLPSFWKMNHCTLPTSQLFCALFPALTIIKRPSSCCSSSSCIHLPD